MTINKFVKKLLIISSIFTYSIADGEIWQNLNLTLGNREISCTWNSSHALREKVYSYQDEFGHFLDQGIQLDWQPNKKHIFSLKVSKINKDTLLDNSILTKIEWQTNQDLYKKKIAYDSKKGVGFFYLPSLFARDSNYKPTLKRILAYYASDSFTNVSPVFLDKRHKTLFKLKLSQDVVLTIDPSNPRDGPIYAMFSYLRCGIKTIVKRELISNLEAGVGYNGFIQLDFDPSLWPFNIQNHEVLTTFALQLPKKVKGEVSFYEPLKLGLITEDYFYQGRRMEANLYLADNWLLKGMTRFGKEDRELFTLKNYTIIMLEKRFVNSQLNLFCKKEGDDKRYGFEFRFGQGEADLMKNILDKKVDIPREPSIYWQGYYWLNNHPEVEYSNFSETIAKLDIPEKVAWYTTNYFGYETDDRYSTPEKVFNTKKGDCVEQMGFEAYTLRQHGYESYILQHIAIGSAHALCIYRDKASGKWNVLNYGSLSNTQANTPEEVFTSAYPGWFRLVIRDPANGKPKTQFDSASTSYVLKWLER